jgi:NAD(P)-dependent dehydrogenase (short-subunit alcohol dehydrogenase family)
MNELDGKVCVVTGGASGIGLAMAQRFQRAGMRVAIGDIEPGALTAAVDALGGDGDKVLGRACDVTSLADMHALRDAVYDRFGAAHVVCLNAGVAAVGPVIGTSIDTWNWLIDVNLRGVVHGIDAFGSGIEAQRDGHFVLTASGAGLVDTPTMGAYGATKHAVVGLAGALRAELRDAGVGVSVVCPGLVRTKIFHSERNRPDPNAVTHTDTVRVEMLRSVLEHGADPATIADAVHDAVVANQLFVIPTSDMVGLVRARLEEVTAALPDGSR